MFRQFAFTLGLLMSASVCAEEKKLEQPPRTSENRSYRRSLVDADYLTRIYQNKWKARQRSLAASGRISR